MDDRDGKGRFNVGNSYSFAHRPEAANRKGRPKGRSLQDNLRAMLDDKETGEGLADALVRAAVDRALKGDFRFWQEIINRIDGKVPQQIDGVEGSSLPFVIDEAVQSLSRNGKSRK